MCPCDKGESLEDIQQGLNYYKQNDIDVVVLQPKYMGNRVQVYLYKNPNSSYIVSRNGYIVSQNDELKRKITELFSRFNPNEYIILDAELMPWRHLGENLIDKSFYGYADLALNELNELNLCDYSSVLEKMKNFVPVNSHQETQKLLYKEILNIPDVAGQDVEKFIDQVNLYGKDDPVEIIPFDILKNITTEETYYTPGISYDIISDIMRTTTKILNAPKVIQLMTQYRVKTTDLVTARKLFKKLTENLAYEGVVIKPDFCTDTPCNIAPYLKCRNPEYLRIIYGPDYLTENKYNKLYNRKNIKSKLNRSIYEFKLGREMLKTNYDNLNSQEYMNLLNKFFKCDQEFDPRL